MAPTACKSSQARDQTTTVTRQSPLTAKPPQRSRSRSSSAFNKCFPPKTFSACPTLDARLLLLTPSPSRPFPLYLLPGTSPRHAMHLLISASSSPSPLGRRDSPVFWPPEQHPTGRRCSVNTSSLKSDLLLTACGSVHICDLVLTHFAREQTGCHGRGQVQDL